MKVASDVRNRLARLASRHGRPLGAELAALVAAAEEREWWQAAEEAAARLESDPEQLADYLAETEAWDTVAGDALPNAAREWPELNQGSAE